MITDPGHDKELLIRLCNTDFENKDIKGIKELTHQVSDWEKFTWLANEHGISALVYDNLRSAGCLDIIPEIYRSVLHNSYLKSLSRNTNLWEKYRELEGLLQGKAINTILIKGMALEKSIYGNKGLRQMNDVDFLVQKEQAQEAWDYLITKGYYHHPLKSRVYRRILPYIGKHMPELIRDGVSFEIHIDANYREFGRIIADWSGGIAEPVVHFLYLVRHLHYHETVKGESQLRLYTDLVLMLKKHREEIQGAELFEVAEQLGLLEILMTKLYIIDLYWSDVLSGTMKSAIKVCDGKKAQARFLDFLDNPKNNAPSVSKRKVYRENVRDIEGLRRKMIFVVGDVFPSMEFMKQRYGKKTGRGVVFYYFHRLGKVLWLVGL